MAHNTPKIASLNPIVMPDNRRIMFELVVEGLPNLFSNVDLMMPDLSPNRPASPPPKPDADTPSPYPNIELTVLNAKKQQLATLFIVEHKEAHTSLTLHLRMAPDIEQDYTARAEMVYQGQTLDVIEIPFRLHQAE